MEFIPCLSKMLIAIMDFMYNLSYTRRVMWLEVGPSNKDPKVVCGYYARCVQKICGKFHL